MDYGQTRARLKLADSTVLEGFSFGVLFSERTETIERCSGHDALCYGETVLFPHLHELFISLLQVRIFRNIKHRTLDIYLNCPANVH